MRRSFIKGFTLAEVLITLTIIGVIAALTIPSLITNIQDAQYRTAWKKVYSDLNQATSRIMMDNGGTMVGICPSNGDNDCLRNQFLKYLVYAKSCNDGQSFGNCWHIDNNNFLALDGTATNWGNNAGAILNNGALVNFFLSTKDCSEYVWGIYRCGTVSVDVNGFKGPNRMGKDIFRIHILATGIKPEGTQEDTIKNLCVGSTGVNSGRSCSAQYLYQ